MKVYEKFLGPETCNLDFFNLRKGKFPNNIEFIQPSPKASKEHPSFNWKQEA